MTPLAQLRKRLLRAEMDLSRARVSARKADTRRKIELGGLIIKAGLDDEERAVILGALLFAAKKMNGPDGDAIRRQLHEMGMRELIP